MKKDAKFTFEKAKIIPKLVYTNIVFEYNLVFANIFAIKTIFTYYVKAIICYFLGINSEKVITFSEWIPKKLYLCKVKIMDYG